MARAVSEGRKREYGTDAWDVDDVPDPQDPATFHRSKLDWRELEREPHRDVLAWYRALIQIRSSSTFTALRNTRPDVQYGDNWIRVDRGPIQILCNLASMNQVLPMAKGAEILLASGEGTHGDGDTAVLAAESVVVLHVVA